MADEKRIGVRSEGPEDGPMVDLAGRYVDRMVAVWAGKGLPPEALAAACLAYGLDASARQDAALTALGLERLAEQLRTPKGAS